MSFLSIYLVNAETVRSGEVLLQTISEAIEPVARQAGKQLNLVRVRTGAPTGAADLVVTFVARTPSPAVGQDRDVQSLRFGEQFIGSSRIGLILGDEGGGNVYLSAILEMRVGGRPQRLGPDPTDIDYGRAIESVFVAGEPDLARCAGNVAVHELGHMIAALPHSPDPRNFMSTGGAVRSRTRQNLRWYWAGRKSFSAAQSNQLVDAIRRGNFRGGMRVSTIAAPRGPASRGRAPGRP